MLSKEHPDEIRSFLSDTSNLSGGHAERVVFPETGEEVAEVLAAATRMTTPVTVSGAGTGTVGGRVPFGGIVLATDKLNHIKSVTLQNSAPPRAVAEAGVFLGDLQRAVEAKRLLYPPDPTERHCFLGGTVATNASGARTFKYGPTRNYVQRLLLALPEGDLLNLRRGELAAERGRLSIPTASGRTIHVPLPSYQMPDTRKNVSGYFVRPDMDALDLFIGSEGTLGVVVEVEVKLVPKPEALFSGAVFFSSETDLLAFVAEARAQSFASRARAKAKDVSSGPGIDARALEYFDIESLRFLREKYEKIPVNAVGAVFFEQEISEATEDLVLQRWQSLLESYHALVEESWFATEEAGQARLREFRHQLPVLMNEWFSRYQQRKVSTDMAVPDAEFAALLRSYQQSLRSTDLRYTIFGHIGDNHVHLNILPRNDSEAATARDLYLTLVRKAIAAGGTISAEHGIGKLKRPYLAMLYGEEHLREMAALKRAFDPAGILGRGNIFAEEFLA
jgi:D-lactate dehydrogenase (cytochrome)